LLANSELRTSACFNVTVDWPVADAEADAALVAATAWSADDLRVADVAKRMVPAATRASPRKMFDDGAMRIAGPSRCVAGRESRAMVQWAPKRVVPTVADTSDT
jgi:hypothetical protein